MSSPLGSIEEFNRAKVGTIPTMRRSSSGKSMFRRTKSRFTEDWTTMEEEGDQNRSLSSVPQNPDDVEEEDEDDIPEKYRRRCCGRMQTIQWCILFILTAGIMCSLTIPGMKQRMPWHFELWKWSIVVFVFFSGRLLSWWIVLFVAILLEQSFIMRKRVLYFVYGMQSGVQNCIWLGSNLLTWYILFESQVQRSPRNQKKLWIINNLFVSLFIASFIWLLKILLLKMLALRFLKSTYFERIHESLFDQYILERLHGLTLAEMERLRKTFGSSNRKAPMQNETLQSPKDPGAASYKAVARKLRWVLHKGDKKNVSVWKMKELVKLVRHPHISSITKKIGRTIQKGLDSKGLEIRTEAQAKVNAKKIFQNVAKPNARFIEKDDLLRFMEEDKVAKFISLFDNGEEVNISESSLINWVVKVFQERRALAYSLNDTKTSVDDLHRLANVAVSVIIIIIAPMIFGISSLKFILFISSQLLLVVFIFGNTFKQIFEAIIFLFVMHPFDVGDRCIIDGSAMVVEEMSILTTVFLRPNNEKVYYPNSVLAMKPISNLYRSPDMYEEFNFAIHMSTSFDKITTLKEKISSFIESNHEKWHPKITLTLKDIEEVNSLQMNLWVQDTMNFQDAVERFDRRSILLFEVKRFFEELGIKYRLLPQEVQLPHIPPPCIHRVI